MAKASNDMTSIEDAIRQLYDQERNVQIATFWDTGCTVCIGDNWSGFGAERTFSMEELGEIGDWILAHVDDPAPARPPVEPLFKP